MKRIIGMAILFSLAASSAQGRLFESRAECEYRYGGPVVTNLAPPLPTIVYTSGFYSVAISYEDDRAISVGFIRLDEKELSENEITILMKANSGSFSWTDSGIVAGDKLWTRSDGASYATIKKAGTMLLFVSQRYIEINSAWRRQQEEQALGRF